MPKEKDTFDYFKATEKEDLYTDLIAASFQASPTFRANFCACFSAKPDPKAKLLLRTPFLYESLIPQRRVDAKNKIVETAHRHARQIPDMTLITQDKIVIIEAKLFAQEGSYQTERYGELRFLEAVKNDKKLASLDLDHVQLHGHRCASLEDQCLFYVTIDGDQAVNPAFVSLSWSDLSAVAFQDLSELPETLQLIMTQMRQRFDSYAKMKAELPSLRETLDLEAFLKLSAKHYLLEKDHLLLTYFDDLMSVRQKMADRSGILIENQTVLGSRQLVITCDDWADPEFNLVLQSVPEGSTVDDLLDKLQDQPYPFSRILIKVHNNRKIAVSIHFEPNPYLSESKLTKRYGSKLVQRFRQGKTLFEAQLQKEGLDPVVTLLQSTKTEFSKKDKDLRQHVLETILNYVSVIDRLVAKETPYE